jgi:hypothetical protein
MNNTNTGGPAFPFEYFDEQLQRAKVMHGMTLRDYFAAKAMLIYFGPDAKVIKNDPDSIASWCYLMADSMLKARER